jgi:diketogulonate reductase-like aldo/keto reductase
MKFIYGTAWKEDQTERLCLEALEAGFMAIDTANQRKHYFEQAAGHGIARYLKTHSKRRQDIFIQTKFTYARGQDHRKPYDDKANYATQVQQSFSSSLEHLNTDYLDSYLLHGPFGPGWSAPDLEVWQAMSDLLKAGKTKSIGVSNVQLDQLQTLCKSDTKPSYVQNRCYANKKWNKDVREFCKQNNIAYQGFSLLTANQQELSKAAAQAIAQKYNKTMPQIVFKFCQQLGMIVITGTTNLEHMRQDLAIDDFELNAGELQTLENIAN